MRIAVLIIVYWIAGSSPGMAQNPTESFGEKFAAAAARIAEADIQYNGAYVSIDYPWGDVPASQGVCTDVVIRALRVMDVDLQQRVHEDMKQNFVDYPSEQVWGLTAPDRNIDHRRVLNLKVFFARQQAELAITDNAADYVAGDIVTWQVPKFGGGTTPHIGVISTESAPDGTRLVSHHLVGRPKLENVLFLWPITGHYRYHVTADARDR